MYSSRPRFILEETEHYAFRQFHGLLVKAALERRGSFDLDSA